MGLSMTAMLDMLDEDARSFAQALLDGAPPPPYSQYGVEGARSILETADAVRHPIRLVHKVEELIIDSPAGPLRMRCYHPSPAADSPAVLYFHGGGFVVGTLNGVDDVCRSLCAEVDCVVISVDYRRAPEHVFPAAADDCLWAYEWVLKEAASLGIDPSRIALAGDSAGGNLALSVCTTLAAARRAMPRSLVLAYPPTSNAHTGPSWETFEHAPILCAADALWFWSNYATTSGADHDPRAVPILSTMLDALPPTFLAAAEVDVLRSDYEQFAAMALCAGAEVTVRQYSGVPHGFFTEMATIGKARHAVADAAHHLRTHFGH